MQAANYIPAEIRNLPLNVKMAELIDYCVKNYHDKYLDPVKDRWQANKPQYDATAIIQELGGEPYLEAIYIDDKKLISRFLDSLFQMKGSKDALVMMFAFLGIRGHVIDYFLWERAKTNDDLIDPELAPSVPEMHACEVYVALQVSQDDLTLTGVELSIFSKIVELFLWSCAELVAILVIRSIFDLTLPQITDELELDMNDYDLGSTSMVFKGLRYNQGYEYGAGAVYQPERAEGTIDVDWGTDQAGWVPQQNAATMVVDEYYGDVWKMEHANFTEEISIPVTADLLVGDRLNFEMSVYITNVSTILNCKVEVENGANNAVKNFIVPRSSFGNWHRVRFAVDVTEDTSTITLRFVTELRHSTDMVGHVMFSRPSIEKEFLRKHVLGEYITNIGMFDRLELIT